jgi:hypothetical protein
MKYNVDGWNNFCRVFELPERFSSSFCFSGGVPTNFQMVDWFNPVPDVGQPTVSKEEWREKIGEIKAQSIDGDELAAMLIGWLRMKPYIRPGRTYLVLCDFGLCFTFIKS